MKYAALVIPALRERQGRILALSAVAGLFLIGATATALTARDPHGGVEMDLLFTVGGYPLVSTILLMGWLLGRFPMLATIVLMAGIASRDRREGYARLYAVRPVRLQWIYAARWAALAAAVFLLSAALLAGFDLLLLGTWGGAATLVLVLSYVLVYGGLVAFLSAWTSADAWLAAVLGIGAIIWHALQRGGAAGEVPPGGRAVLNFILPPHGALFSLESAFADLEPIPWDSFGYCAGYGILLLVLAGISLWHREI